MIAGQMPREYAQIRSTCGQGSTLEHLRSIPSVGGGEMSKIEVENSATENGVTRRGIVPRRTALFATQR